MKEIEVTEIKKIYDFVDFEPIKIHGYRVLGDQPYPILCLLFATEDKAYFMSFCDNNKCDTIEIESRITNAEQVIDFWVNYLYENKEETEQ